MLRTLLLGANGFLGNEIENFIKQHKNKDSKILKISKKEFIRDQNKMETILQGFKPDRVINIISPRLQLSPTEMQVRFSCFDAPKLIFDSIKNLEQKCTWIDCGTYWEVSENNLKSIERYYVDTKKKFKHYSV
jgi:N-acetyl-gamma-glutamylphosphate reductase